MQGTTTSSLPFPSRFATTDVPITCPGNASGRPGAYGNPVRDASLTFTACDCGTLAAAMVSEVAGPGIGALLT
jgi:hypothetical protein